VHRSQGKPKPTAVARLFGVLHAWQGAGAGGAVTEAMLPNIGSGCPTRSATCYSLSEHRLEEFTEVGWHTEHELVPFVRHQ
jgi:hypothetical protein